MTKYSFIEHSKECNLKIQFILIGLAGWALAACSPSPTQLKKAMKEHPDIVFSAIKADPSGFFAAVEKAQSEAHKVQLDQALGQDIQKVESELKNPQTVKISANRAIWGSANAPVTIVEWADFNCGHCQQEQSVLQKIMANYSGKVRIVYKELPILAPESKVAAQYMEALAMQNNAQALQFHDLIFANQDKFRMEGDQYLKRAVKNVGANLFKVEQAARSAKVKKRIADDQAEAKKFGITGTPGFAINGAIVNGSYPYEFFRRVIDHILKSAPAGATPAEAPSSKSS